MTYSLPDGVRHVPFKLDKSLFLNASISSFGTAVSSFSLSTTFSDSETLLSKLVSCSLSFLNLLFFSSSHSQTLSKYLSLLYLCSLFLATEEMASFDSFFALGENKKRLARIATTKRLMAMPI